MGNTTNPQKWDARQRLEFIEQAAFWRGWVHRADIVKAFGQSLSQASADLQAYQALNPDSLRYDLRTKRYWAAAEMKLKLTPPDLSAAIAQFLGPRQRATAGDRFAMVDLPFRRVPLDVTKFVFRAIFQERAMEIDYLSLRSRTEGWRWIAPHAFAHDGYRWHVRAYCFRDRTYKDFVIGRIAKARPPAEKPVPALNDEDWTTWETIKLRPHHSLDAIQRRAIHLDYNMRHGVVSMEVRRALKIYSLAYLGLSASPTAPRQLELA
jgi:hypothetical protein